MSRRLLVSLTTLVLATPLAARAEFEKEALPFVKKFCARCHNAKTKRGDLDLERFQTSADVKKEALVWEQAAARTRAHEMPPDGAKRPSIEARRKFLAWAKTIERKDKDCKEGKKNRKCPSPSPSEVAPSSEAPSAAPSGSDVPGAPSLPVTGSSTLVVAATAAALVLFGAVLFVVARRRRFHFQS